MSVRAFYQVRCDQHRCTQRASKTFYVKPEKAVEAALKNGWQNLVKDGVPTEIWFCPWHHTGVGNRGAIIKPSLVGYSYRDRLDMATQQLLESKPKQDYSQPPPF